MRPKLNRRLHLDAPTRVADAAGGFTESWSTLGAHWAEVTPGAGREAEFAGLNVARVPYKIVVRATPHGAPSRPEPGQRFRDGARVFMILAVTSADSREHYLLCYAQEEEIAP